MGTFGANFGANFDATAVATDKTPAERALNVVIGESISAAVKPSNEVAVEADPALVVAMSPNSADLFLSKADFNARINTLGQKLKAESTPVTFASDQEPFAVFVSSPAGAETRIVTGTVTLGGSTANTVNAIRATAYNEQTTNAIRALKSTSADDSASGIGARKVIITYFDQLVQGPFTEEVTLNGLTAVQTVNTNICYVESIFVTVVGSSLANVGTVSLYASSLGTGTVIGSVGTGNIAGSGGDNRTFWAHHYVPVGRMATLSTFIVSATSGGSGTNASFFLRARNPLVANEAEVVVSDILVTVASIVRQLTNPIKLIGPARVVAYGVPAVNNATLSASFDLAEDDS